MTFDYSEYFKRIESQLATEWEIAEQARSKGEDPTRGIEIVRTDDMAERCEKFLGVDGLAPRIRELAEDGADREDMAFELTDAILEDEVGDFDSPEDKIEYSIRTALALLTEAVVAAPLEGLQWVRLETDSSGREYIRIRYGGPVRSAGGTAQVISVIIADYCRQHYGYDEFVPTSDEVERYVEEKNLYDRDTGLQYTPSDDEVRTIIQNTPVMLDAEATTEEEVSGYRDLDRIESNGGRGGMCLVAFEGIAQKVPKIQKYTSELGLDGWDWLRQLPNASKVDTDKDSEESGGSEDTESDSESSTDSGENSQSGAGSVSAERRSDDSTERMGVGDPVSVKPKTKYIDETLTAGRPIFGHPSSAGGFRLRYGRARNTGHAACGFSPATMVILDEFIAPATQLKTERPGKAAGAAPVDGLEGPTVRMKNGTVKRIDDEEEAERLKSGIDAILDLGEIGVPYGEFLENNAQLAPASYVHEWWVQEAEEAGLDVRGMNMDVFNVQQAIAMAEKYDIPLHPEYTYLWHDITLEDYYELSEEVEAAGTTDSPVMVSDSVTETLEQLLVPHTQTADGAELEQEEFAVLELCCDPSVEAESVIEAVNEAAGITVRRRAPTRIGARMGRPEKAERRTFRRELNIHCLFPVGEGNDRSVLEAASNQNTSSRWHNETQSDDENTLGEGEIREEVCQRRCPECGRDMWRVTCPACDERTVGMTDCPSCGSAVSFPVEEMGETECGKCGETVTERERQVIDIEHRLEEALDTLNIGKAGMDDVKGVEGLVSQSGIPEPLEKGVLRAKHDIGVYKDGTARYDVSDLPLTSFRPEEIQTDVETLHELGYTHDINGDPLEEPSQVVELRIQDVVVPDEAGEYLLRVANYIDELLDEYYEMEPYYEADTKEDLVGSLLIGMAPHTSAGTACRIIGFTDALAQYGHPFFHAAKRRNCFHPDTYVHVSDAGDELAGFSGEKIGELVESRISEYGADEIDDRGTKVTYLPDDDLEVMSVTGDGEGVVKQVNAVSKHPSPDHLVHLEVGDHWDITVTPDHEMTVVDSDGNVSEKRASSLKVGDEIVKLFMPPVGGDEIPETDDRVDESLDVVQVTGFELVQSDTDYTYCFEVEDTHRLFANQLAASNCDGDEDAFMLLLDGLLNYSEQYLNHHKSGWSMDEPIVMSTRIDPAEIDDEAHNVDIPSEYPLEFYEATYDGVGPKDVEIPIGEDVIENPVGFNHSLTTSSINGGPKKSSYKTLPDMDAKIDQQFDLSQQARAVDSRDVAERLVDGHFMADFRGNIRAFGTQDIRCVACNAKYRRVPLEGHCRRCGGDDTLLLTVFEGSVTKYLENMQNIADGEEIDPYLRDIIGEFRRIADSLFTDQTNKQANLAQFM